MSHIVPIIVPSYNLEALFSGASKALGYNITNGIDSTPGNFTDDAKIISALYEFAGGKPGKIRDHVRDADHELFFLYYGFLVLSDSSTIAAIREWTRLDVTSATALNASTVAVVAGNVGEWKRATRECCSEKATFNLRLLFDKILLYFEHVGLADVWFDVRKRSLPDQTFLLEDKR